MQIKIVQVNAFSANSKGGNPAGIVLGSDALSDSQMQSIAKQAAFSETAFISDSSIATQNIRFYTPTDEVDLCGHATIASWSYMFQQGILPSGSYTQNTKAGLLKVNVDGSGLIFMEQSKAQFFSTVNAEEVAQILNIEVSDFHSGLKPQIVSTGLKDLLVPVASEAVLNNICPDFNAMSEMSKKYEIVGLHAFALTTDVSSLASVRNFAPLFGIDEESATGTSNGALLCYLRKYNALPNKNKFLIEQGRAMNQLSQIYGTFEGETIWIGGLASIIKDFEINI